MKPITPISPLFSPPLSSGSPPRSKAHLQTGPSEQPTQPLNPLNRSAAQSAGSGAGRGTPQPFEQVLSDAQKRSTLRDDRQRLRDDQPVKAVESKPKKVDEKKSDEEDENESTPVRKTEEGSEPTEQTLVMQAGEQPTMAETVVDAVNETVVVNDETETQADQVMMLEDVTGAAAGVEMEVTGESPSPSMIVGSGLESDQPKSTGEGHQAVITAQTVTDASTQVKKVGAGEVTDQQKQATAQHAIGLSKAEQGPVNATSHVGHVQNEMNVEVVNTSTEGQASEEGESEQGNAQQTLTGNSGKAQGAGTAGAVVTPGAGAVMNQTGGEGQAVMQSSQPTTMVSNTTQTTATAASSFAQVTTTGAQGQGAMSEAGGQGDVNAARIARGLQSALAQRGGTVTLRLHPPELGILKVQMQIQEGQVRAQFVTESAAAKGLLTQELGNLRTALERQGLTVERLEVQMQPTQTANMQGGQQSMSQQEQMEDGRSRGQFTRQGGQGDSGFGQERGNEGRDETGGRSGGRGFAEQLVNAMA